MKSIYLFIFMIFAGSMIAQNTVSGVIMDGELDEPLVGATVMVKGTTNGTITDGNGNFTISAADATGNLVVSYVGYESMEIPYGGTAGYNLSNITLASSAMGLSEVVKT